MHVLGVKQSRRNGCGRLSRHHYGRTTAAAVLLATAAAAADAAGHHLAHDRTHAERLAGGLPSTGGAGSDRAPRLIDQSLRHQPHGVALADHDVGEAAALGGHPDLSADVVLVHGIDESVRTKEEVVKLTDVQIVV